MPPRTGPTQLGVVDVAAVVAAHHELLLEAEGLLQELDAGGRVSVAEARPDGGCSVACHGCIMRPRPPPRLGRMGAVRPATPSGSSRPAPGTRGSGAPGRSSRTSPPRRRAPGGPGGRAGGGHGRSAAPGRRPSGVRPSSCWNRCARWRRLHPTSLASAATSMAPPVATSRSQACTTSAAGAGPSTSAACRTSSITAKRAAHVGAERNRSSHSSARRPSSASRPTTVEPSSPAGRPNRARAPKGVRSTCTPRCTCS